MKLTLTVRAALLLYAVGMVIFFVRDQDQMTWFALGGGLALVNILAAAWSVKMGLISLQKSGLILVMEPLNAWTNHPGLFLTKIPQANLICEAVNHPSCKIVNDLYHQQIIIPRIRLYSVEKVKLLSGYKKILI
jgi:hypothetical protein